MHCVEKQRLKRLADKKVNREASVKRKVDVKPCSRCGQASFNWDYTLMIKTCKNDKCNDVSGVM